MRSIICVLLVIANTCHAQTDTVLDNYLATHRYAINTNSDSTVSFADNTLPIMLEQKMHNKRLFVYAEGFNHELKLNKDLRMMFEAYFATHGLKYYFEEGRPIVGYRNKPAHSTRYNLGFGLLEEEFL